MELTPRRDTAVLRMHCPDSPGIIAVLTEFINNNGGNILYLDQYVDRVNSILFMRDRKSTRLNSSH